MVNEQTVKDGLLEIRATLAQKYESIKVEFLELEQQIQAIDLLLSKQFENVGSENTSSEGQRELRFPKDSTINEGELDQSTGIADTVADAESTDGAIELPKTNNGNGKLEWKRERKGTLRDTARQHFNELPNLFTKDDVAELIERHHKALNGERVNENSLFGVMRDLVRKNLAKVKIASKGTSAQIYEKKV